MAYGVSYPDIYRHAAKYVDRILKGAKPSDPSSSSPPRSSGDQPENTAKALGLTIPQTLLQRADQIIQ